MNEWQVKLNEMRAKFKEWWQPLAMREKQAVAIGVSVVAIFIIYALIWSPLLNAAAAMRGRIQSEQKTLLWMQAADREIEKVEKQTQNKNNIIAPVALLSLLQQQIDAAGLGQTLTQLKQASNDSIEMHFQKVSFDKLIKLLTKTLKEHAVSITQMSVVADATPGAANVDVVLKLE